MTAPLKGFLRQFDNYDDFEKQFSEEFLNEDARIGRYLGDLLYKYDKKASVVSFDAHLNHSYVGNVHIQIRIVVQQLPGEDQKFVHYDPSRDADMRPDDLALSVMLKGADQFVFIQGFI